MWALVLGLVPVPAAAGELGEAVVRLLAADPLPEQSLDPRGRYLLLVHERGLLPPEQLAEPSITIAGLRINPKTHARHAAMPYSGLTLVDIESGRTRRLSVPAGIRIGYPRWSPDGNRYFFSATVATGVELWTGTRERPQPRRLLGPVLNATRSTPCDWMPGGDRLLCRVAVNRGAAQRPKLPGEPRRFGLSPSNSRREALAEYFLRSQLVAVDAASGEARDIGDPAIFESVAPSPDGRQLLVERRLAPYARAPGGEDFHSVHEVWDRSGRVVATIDAGGVRPRAVHWQPSAAATVVWVVRRGQVDHILAHSLPFRGPPRVVHRTTQRFAGLRWLESDDRALVSEYDSIDRVTRVWLVGGDADRPRLVGSRHVDGRRAGIGRPLTARDTAGNLVVAVHDGRIFLRGHGAAAAADRPVLARLNLDTLAAEPVWMGEAGGREAILGMLAPDGRRLLTRREGRRDPPDYLVRDLRAGTVRSLTERRHPVPALREAERRVLRYQRDDGLQMSATLYLPPGASRGERLPLILWAYPRRYEAGDTPPALTASERFVDVARSLRLFFLLRGYAVLDDVAMPVTGKPGEANDTFVEQVVANARAAVDAAAATGTVDPARVGVAGHSYGAFMAANLLAHSRLFRAGVGLSGAYNRTLTPFGFQTERRTLWQARETYLKMSPFLYSDQIEAPLLLVHGLLDDNAGTSPMQSQYFYEAIRRTGGNASLLLLPREGHTYRGRPAVMNTAAAMLRWFDTYLKPDSKPQDTMASSAAGDAPPPTLATLD